MANITVRNIPDDVFEKIKALSLAERRSINNELLFIIERGTYGEYEDKLAERYPVSKSTQIELWNKLLGSWEDNRTTEEIITDIHEHRTLQTFASVFCTVTATYSSDGSKRMNQSGSRS